MNKQENAPQNAPQTPQHPQARQAQAPRLDGAGRARKMREERKAIGLEQFTVWALPGDAAELMQIQERAFAAVGYAPKNSGRSGRKNDRV